MSHTLKEPRGVDRQTVDRQTWPRRQHFDFFRDFDNPFFNLCAPLDVTALTAYCRAERGPSFFLASFYLSLKAANAVEEMRYRIRGEEVVIHETVHGGSTVLRPDDTFLFAYFDYLEDFSAFHKAGQKTLEEVKEGPDHLQPSNNRDDLLHYTVIPWVAFTSFSHARRWGNDDSIPKVVFGKRHRVGERYQMPVSLEVHHALVDGLHAGRWFERFQEYLDQPERFLAGE